MHLYFLRTEPPGQDFRWIFRRVEYLLRRLQHRQPEAKWGGRSPDAPALRLWECHDDSGAGMRHCRYLGRLSIPISAQRKRYSVPWAALRKFCGHPTTQGTPSKSESIDVFGGSIRYE